MLSLINQKSTKFKQHDAPKRPKELSCDIGFTKVKGKEYCILIGLYENKPYEVFVYNFKQKPIVTNDHCIIKEKKKYYLECKTGEGYGFGNIVENLSDEEATITRLVSTALRHGADIKFIVEQLNKTHGDLTNFGKAIARVLTKYTKKETGLECPKCKQNTLIKEGGCTKCTNCSNSKCN